MLFIRSESESHCSTHAMVPTHRFFGMTPAHGALIVSSKLVFDQKAADWQPLLFTDEDAPLLRAMPACRQVFYTQSLQDGGFLEGAPEAVTALVLTPDWLVAGTETGATCQWSTHLRNGVR